MELDNLKSAWQQMGGENKNNDALKKMLSENRHPVLKRIRLQMIIEITLWTFFLLVFYDIFDGNKKPFYTNVLLVAAVVLVLIHSVTGYLSAKELVKGNNIRQSLVNYMANIKRYATLSVVSRVFTALCLLAFFVSTIQFNTEKYLLLAGILLLIPVQVFFLSRIWRKRIQQLKATLNGLSE